MSNWKMKVVKSPGLVLSCVRMSMKLRSENEEYGGRDLLKFEFSANESNLDGGIKSLTVGKTL